MRRAAADLLLPVEAVLFLALLAALPSAQGQTLEVLHAFQGSDGWGPYGALVQAADGNFYGTTLYGGNLSLTNRTTYLPDGWGTVFKMTPTGTMTTLVLFNGTNGAHPSGLTLGTDGNLYGTTSAGGALGAGTVFKMAPDGTLTTLVSFNGANGPFDGNPNPSLVQSHDGNFYGTTYSGGARGDGTVFQMTPEGALTTLHAFTGGADGRFPEALRQGDDGYFYGTTIDGGAYGMGTAFKLATNGSLTTLRSFNFNPAATAAGGLMQASDGALYGISHPYSDLSGTGGTVFRMTPNGQFTTLISFDDVGSAVGYAYSPPIQASDGSLYGTTGFFFRTVFLSGIVYKLMPDGTWATLVTLDATGATGRSLVQGIDGNLYGTAVGSSLSLDDAYGPGALFRVVMPSAALPPLNIACSGNTVLLTWPASAGNAVLEMADAPQGATWTQVPIPPVQIGDQMAATVKMDSQTKFFRLRQP